MSITYGDSGRWPATLGTACAKLLVTLIGCAAVTAQSDKAPSNWAVQRTALTARLAKLEGQLKQLLGTPDSEKRVQNLRRRVERTKSRIKLIEDLARSPKPVPVFEDEPDEEKKQQPKDPRIAQRDQELRDKWRSLGEKEEKLRNRFRLGVKNQIALSHGKLAKWEDDFQQELDELRKAETKAGRNYTAKTHALMLKRLPEYLRLYRAYLLRHTFYTGVVADAGPAWAMRIYNEAEPVITGLFLIRTEYWDLCFAVNHSPAVVKHILGSDSKAK